MGVPVFVPGVDGDDGAVLRNNGDPGVLGLPDVASGSFRRPGEVWRFLLAAGL